MTLSTSNNSGGAASPALPTRPGIPSTALLAAGIRHVDADEAYRLVRVRQSGILIPYFDTDGVPLMVNGRHFCRLRPNDPHAPAKYISPSGSGVQLYIPPGLDRLRIVNGTLYITEGEFKALCLMGLGHATVAVGGITCTCPRDETGQPRLLPALANLLQLLGIRRIVFVGDNDTAFIAAFSAEMVKLRRCLPGNVELALLRIPVDAVGKAPDDLAENLGPAFQQVWAGYLNSAERVTPDATPTSLALRLLQREIPPEPRNLPPRDFEKFQAGLVKLASGFLDDVITLGRIVGISRSFELSRESVLTAARVRRDRDVRRAQAELLLAILADETCLAFDGHTYLRFEGAVWRSISREDARLHLCRLGLLDTGPRGEATPVNQALHRIQIERRVDYAGPLCGRQVGFRTEDGSSILVTRSPAFIEGVPGASPRIDRYLDELFGVGTDEHGARQKQVFLAWLKIGRQAVRNQNTNRPGQALIVVGPRNAGKSLLVDMIIRPGLGGRTADASAFFLGRTEFNAELWRSELLVIGDQGLGDSPRERVNLRDNIKRFVAEPIQVLRQMYHDAVSLRPIRRLVVTANDSPETMPDLPTLDADCEDKIIYLRVHPPAEPFYCASSPGAREAFAATLASELPAFLDAVDRFAIPEDLRGARFGVREFHHPVIVEALEATSPAQPFEEALTRWLELTPATDELVLTSSELYHRLVMGSGVGRPRYEIASTVNHLSRQMNRLQGRPGQTLFGVRHGRAPNGSKRKFWVFQPTGTPLVLPETAATILGPGQRFVAEESSG